MSINLPISGLYICNASNDQGSSQLPPIDVIVSEKGMGANTSFTSNNTSENIGINSSIARTPEYGLKARGKGKKKSSDYCYLLTGAKI